MSKLFGDSVRYAFKYAALPLMIPFVLISGGLTLVMTRAIPADHIDAFLLFVVSMTVLIAQRTIAAYEFRMHETKEEVSKKELLDVAMKTVKTAHDELIQTLLSSDTVFAGIHVEYEAVRSLVKSTQEMVVELRQRMSELERRHEIIEGLPIIRLRLTEQEILASGKVTIENKKL